MISTFKRLSLVIFTTLVFSLNLNSTDIEISGFIESENQKTISTKYNGYVEKVFVKEGDIVKKGDTLIMIDSKEMSSSKSQIELSIEQAHLTYNINKNDLKKASDDYERYKKLYDKEMLSKQSFEDIELKKANLERLVSISQKQINQLQEKLKEIDKQFKYLDIKALNKSMVISKKISEGELAVATMPLLVLSDIENLVLYLDISESDLKTFRDKKIFKIYIESLDLYVDSKLDAILPAVDNALHSFRVKLSFKSSDTRILPGMYAKIVLK